MAISDKGFAELHQQQTNGRHQTKIKRRQQPAASENEDFKSVFDTFHGFPVD
jgi:hypothetical protein